MKKVWFIVIILLLLAGLGYTQRHAIKSMLMGSPAQAPTTTMAKPSPVNAMTGSTSAAAPTDNIYKTATDKTKGQYVTDFQGMTLYTFDKDTKGVSNCEGPCLALWPVYTSGATAQKTFPANISVITRKDGSKQFAWKDMPLYYYSKDTKAGKLTGDGFGGIWHIVKP